MNKSHYEHREPPLRYQTKPVRSRRQGDTLGIFSYLLAFAVSSIALATALFLPFPADYAEQDRLFMVALLTFLSSATFSLLITEMKEKL